MLDEGCQISDHLVAQDSGVLGKRNSVLARNLHGLCLSKKQVCAIDLDVIGSRCLWETLRFQQRGRPADEPSGFWKTSGAFRRPQQDTSGWNKWELEDRVSVAVGRLSQQMKTRPGLRGCVMRGMLVVVVSSSSPLLFLDSTLATPRWSTRVAPASGSAWRNRHTKVGGMVYRPERTLPV